MSNMKLIMESWDEFIAEQSVGRTTAADYRAQVRTDRGEAGAATGVDDKERNLLLNLQKKLAAVAKVDNITTGPVLALAQRLATQLDKILEKHQTKK